MSILGVDNGDINSDGNIVRVLVITLRVVIMLVEMMLLMIVVIMLIDSDDCNDNDRDDHCRMLLRRIFLIKN